MSAKRFAWLVFLGLVILTVYFILTGNTFRSYTVDIDKELRNTKIDGRQNYTDMMRLRAEQYHLHCGDQGQKQYKSESLRTIIVNDERKVLYCSIPKIACSNLRRVFLILTGKTNQTDPLKLTNRDVNKYAGYLTRLNSYSKEQIAYRLQHYRKVLFVREPFERILSAYRNKFFPPGEDFFIRQYGRQIIRTFRSNASEESLKLGNDVTFGEFVQYLIKLHKNRQPFNEHWATYSDLCSPCQIQYDFVGRFETMDDDVDFLLELMGVSDTIRFPRRNETYKTTETNDLLYQFYRRINPNNIEMLRNIYADDSKLFDYPIPGEIIKVIGEREP